MAENEPTEKSYTLEGRIAERFPALVEKLTPEVSAFEIGELAKLMRRYLSTEATLDDDHKGWFMLEKHMTERLLEFNPKNAKQISPWHSARLKLLQRVPKKSIASTALKFEIGMQDVYLAEKEDVSIETLLERRKAANNPSSRTGSMENHKLVGRGITVSNVLGGRLTRRGL